MMTVLEAVQLCLHKPRLDPPTPNPPFSTFVLFLIPGDLTCTFALRDVVASGSHFNKCQAKAINQHVLEWFGPVVLPEEPSLCRYLSQGRAFKCRGQILQYRESGCRQAGSSSKSENVASVGHKQTEYVPAELQTFMEFRCLPPCTYLLNMSSWKGTINNFQRLLVSAFCSGNHQTVHRFELKKTTYDRPNTRW